GCAQRRPDLARRVQRLHRPAGPRHVPLSRRLLIALAAVSGEVHCSGALHRPEGGKPPYLEMRAIVPLSIRRIAVAMAVGVAVAGPALGASGPTSLRVLYRASADAKPLTFTLRCDPASGTVRRPASACRRLAAGGRALFAPTPPGVACTQIYGGPQTAVITGT